LLPDYVIVDGDDTLRLLEVKGAIGTRSSLTGPITKGRAQLNNVSIILNAHGTDHGYVAATHFCVEGMHPRSETTTVIDVVPAPPPRPPSNSGPWSNPSGPGPQQGPPLPIPYLISGGYLKALRFAKITVLDSEGNTEGVDVGATPDALADAIAVAPKKRLSGLEGESVRILGTNVFGATVFIAESVCAVLTKPNWTSDELQHSLPGYAGPYWDWDHPYWRTKLLLLPSGIGLMAGAR